METLNVRDYLLAWSYLDSTVLAYARNDTGSTSVDAMAALTIRIKNWLAPWLQTIETLAQSESGSLGTFPWPKKRRRRERCSVVYTLG